MLSLRPVGKYSVDRSSAPLIASSESLILSYDESPRPTVRLFDSHFSLLTCLVVPSCLVDMCYSSHLDSFVLLSTTSLYRLNPLMCKIELLNDYHRLKENRSMSSICSTGDERLLILYRFGEYLDTHPRGKRLWKRRHLCDSISEDIALVRSSKGAIFQVALLIVEWNGVWRVDVFSASMHKLHVGFRFTGWTRDTWLSEWSPYNCWFVASEHLLAIDNKGQPINLRSNNEITRDTINITWLIGDDEQTIKTVTRGHRLLTFFE